MYINTTEECEAKDSYVMCERCTESVHKQLYDLHQMEDYCRGMVALCEIENFNKCEICLYVRTYILQNWRQVLRVAHCATMMYICHWTVAGSYIYSALQVVLATLDAVQKNQTNFNI